MKAITKLIAYVILVWAFLTFLSCNPIEEMGMPKIGQHEKVHVKLNAVAELCEHTLLWTGDLNNFSGHPSIQKMLRPQKVGCKLSEITVHLPRDYF